MPLQCRVFDFQALPQVPRNQPEMGYGAPHMRNMALGYAYQWKRKMFHDVPLSDLSVWIPKSRRKLIIINKVFRAFWTITTWRLEIVLPHCIQTVDHRFSRSTVPHFHTELGRIRPWWFWSGGSLSWGVKFTTNIIGYLSSSLHFIVFIWIYHFFLGKLSFSGFGCRFPRVFDFIPTNTWGNHTTHIHPGLNSLLHSWAGQQPHGTAKVPPSSLETAWSLLGGTGGSCVIFRHKKCLADWLGYDLWSPQEGWEVKFDWKW